MRRAGSFCWLTLPFKQLGQRSPGFKEGCAILTRSAPRYAAAPLRPCPGFGFFPLGVALGGGELPWGVAPTPAFSRTFRVFSVLGFANSARKRLMVYLFPRSFR